MLQAALATRWQGRAPLVYAPQLPEAVAKARALAESGDVVLLSPACTSFDQYPNFEVRGRHFAELVTQFAHTSATPADGRLLMTSPREERRQRLGPPDAFLMVLVGALILIGLQVVFSATFALSLSEHNPVFYYLMRQGLWAVVGSLLLLLCMRVDYHLWITLSPALIALALVLLILVLIPISMWRLTAQPAGSVLVHCRLFNPVSS